MTRLQQVRTWTAGRLAGEEAGKWTLRFLSIALFLLVWQIWASGPDVLILAPPTAIVESLIFEVFVGKDLLFAVVQALKQAVIGFGLAAVFGVSIGFVTGYWEPARNVLGPVFDALYAVPVIALVPLIIIWFGFSTLGKVVLVFLFSLFVIIFNTEEGVKGTPQGLIDAARIYGASDWQVYRHVHFRHSLPFILIGLRLGAGRAVRGMVVAELFVSAGLLGAYLMDSSAMFQIPRLIAGIALLSIVGVAAVSIIRVIELRLLTYRNVSE